MIPRFLSRLVLATFLILIGLSSCKNKSTVKKELTYCDYSSLSNGQEIPWEWVIQFKETTTDSQKHAIVKAFSKLVADSVVSKYTAQQEAIHTGTTINIELSKYKEWVERCFCELNMDLITIGIEVEEGIASAGVSTTNDLEPNDKNCSGSLPSLPTYYHLQPSFADLDSIRNLPEVLGITRNKLLLPKPDIRWSQQKSDENCSLRPAEIQVVQETKKEELVIAIIDSGLEPCFQRSLIEDDRMWKNGADEHEDKCHPSKNMGWNFIELNTDLNDMLGHGTKVTFLANEEYGDHSCNVKFMILKIFSACYGSTFHGACAIDYAVDHGATIINTSWGMYGEDELLESATNHAYLSKIPVIASAGNDCSRQGVMGCLDHIPSDYSLHGNGRIIPVCGINGDLPWGWNNSSSDPLTSPLYVENILAGEPQGTNVFVGIKSLAEQAVHLIDIAGHLPDGGSSTVFSGNIEGTSFSAPILTAKLGKQICCNPDDYDGNDLHEFLFDNLSSEVIRGSIHEKSPFSEIMFLPGVWGSPSGVIPYDAIIKTDGLRMNQLDERYNEDCHEIDRPPL